MKTHYQYLICFGPSPTALELMPDFRVELCEYLVGAEGVYLWIEQSEVTLGEAVTRHFVVTRPGRSVPDDYDYIDSAIDPFGSRAHHVFQLPVRAPEPRCYKHAKSNQAFFAALKGVMAERPVKI